MAWVLLVILGATCADAQPADTTKDLIAQLESPNWETRRRAAQLLGRMGSQAAPAVPALVIALTDENEHVRHFAAAALGHIGPDAAPAIPALTAALSDEQEPVRAHAAFALGKVGPDAAAAVPALVESLSDEEAEVHHCAVHALDQISTCLKSEDTVLWWTVPRVYWKQLLTLLLLLGGWFALALRYPRYRPATRTRRVGLSIILVVPPTTLSCSAVCWVITRSWAHGFLPHTLTLVPFSLAAPLSAAFVCVLAGAWVYQRKALAPLTNSWSPNI